MKQEAVVLHEIDAFPAREHAHEPKLLSEQPTIHPSARIHASRIGGWTELGAHTTIVQSTFDDYSYAAGDVSIIYADVGKFCSIASHVRINPGNHPMDRVTQHHMTYRRVQYGFDVVDDAGVFAWREAARCTIGHDVWIGHAATVMPGVCIGSGAVVGAGAVVTHNVAPYDIVVGVPARRLRSRFSADVVAQLLAIAWWEWDRATLQARFHDLLDMQRFLKLYAGGEGAGVIS
ncbi:MAG: acetyltransferase [Chloroflexales bacterium]|nr:acetyltransferase [Chloroflexales bacterium]